MFKIFDTTARWLQWSTINVTAAVILHIIWSGWVGASLFFYNWYNAAWWGPYFSNIAHFWACYAIAGLLFNFNISFLRHPNKWVKIIVCLVLIWAVTLAWEFAELLYFNVHLGFQVGELDSLLDLTTGMLGALVGVYHAEKAIP
jgi:hypothetical protein